MRLTKKLHDFLYNQCFLRFLDLVGNPKDPFSRIASQMTCEKFNIPYIDDTDRFAHKEGFNAFLAFKRKCSTYHQENMSMKCIPPETPLLYSKIGVDKGIIPIFLIFTLIYRLWVLV